MALADQLKRPEVAPALLFELELPGGTRNFWTGFGSITLEGVTYLTLPGIDAGVSVIESLDLGSLTTGMRLAGLEGEILALALIENFQNSQARVHFATLDDEGRITARETVFEGELDDMPVNQQGSQESQLEIEMSHKMAALSATYDIRYTPGDQAKVIAQTAPGIKDTIFDAV
jgi:hypothetical protein